MAPLIRDLMTRNVEKVEPDSSVRKAAEILKDRDIGSLPVCIGKTVLGMLTDRDIVIRVVAEGRDSDTTRVRDIMSTDVVSVREDSDLIDAERIMHDRQLRRLPVLNARDELVGYLSMARVARTEAPIQSGRVLQGVSQASAPAPMTTNISRRQKSG